MIFSQSKFLFMVFLIISLVSVDSSAFVEQVMSYGDKYQTAVGLFSAGGSFQETAEEPEMDMGGAGIFGEVHLRRSPWALRIDLFSTERKTGNEGLGVSNQYREVRAWGLGFAELSETFSFYGGLGAGILFPKTMMTVLGDSASITGKSNALGGYVLGLRWRSPVGLFLDLWSQSVYVPVYPNGTLTTAALALGYQF